MKDEVFKLEMSKSKEKFIKKPESMSKIFGYKYIYCYHPEKSNGAKIFNSETLKFEDEDKMGYFINEVRESVDGKFLYFLDYFQVLWKIKRETDEVIYKVKLNIKELNESSAIISDDGKRALIIVRNVGLFKMNTITKKINVIKMGVFDCLKTCDYQMLKSEGTILGNRKNSSGIRLDIRRNGKLNFFKYFHEEKYLKRQDEMYSMNFDHYFFKIIRKDENVIFSDWLGMMMQVNDLRSWKFLKKIELKQNDREFRLVKKFPGAVASLTKNFAFILYEDQYPFSIIYYQKFENFKVVNCYLTDKILLVDNECIFRYTKIYSHNIQDYIKRKRKEKNKEIAA